MSVRVGARAGTHHPFPHHPNAHATLLANCTSLYFSLMSAPSWMYVSKVKLREGGGGWSG